MASNCKRCLLKDLSDDDYFKGIYDYISSLGEDVRTPEDEYLRRLALCRECTHLINGMCGMCGCFVEVRAAKKDNHCAKSPLTW